MTADDVTELAIELLVNVLEIEGPEQARKSSSLDALSTERFLTAVQLLAGDRPVVGARPVPAPVDEVTMAKRLAQVEALEADDAKSVGGFDMGGISLF